MIHIFQSMVIRKGDGNYGLFGGGMQNMRYPPPEAMVDDPNIPDVPPFAHTGAHGEEESGVPGVGHLIPGDWTIGKHGELVYKDKSGGEHMHGLDGIIRAVGDSFIHHGLDVPAKDVVQKAIELHNQDHHEELPHIDDPAWRKTHLAPFQGMDHKARSNFGPNGELITATTNGHGGKHELGTFLESCTVPFNKHLGQSMGEAGHPNPGKHNWVKYPYVKPYRLHLIPDPENPGQMKPGAWHIDAGQRGGGNTLPPEHMGKWGGQISYNPEFKDISAWGVVHKLPDVYALPHNTGGPYTNKRPALVAAAVHHIKQALGHDPSSIGTLIHQTVKPSDIKGELNGKPLSLLLSSDAGIQELATTLAQYPKFGCLFGESRMPKFDAEGNTTNRGSPQGMLHHLYSSRYGDNLPEGRGLEHFMSHTTRVGVEHQHNPSNTLHARARHIQANDLLAATAGLNHRDDNLTPEEVAHHEIPIQDTPETRAAAPAISGTIDTLASMMALATGHKIMDTPSAEELQAIAPIIQNKLLGGTSEDPAQMGVPDYMRYIEAPQQMPVASQPPSNLPPGKPTGVAGAPVATHALPPKGGTTAATSVPPPPPSSRPVAVTPGLTPFQQARQQFGQASMPDVRATMEEAGIRLPQDEARAQQHMEGFQQHMGDPYQRFLSEYTKSADDPKQAQDRLIKAIEILQLEDAKEDSMVRKYVPVEKKDRQNIEDVRFMAEKMDLTPLDVETILHSKGDWERITKTYGYSDKVVKVVKVSFGGV